MSAPAKETGWEKKDGGDQGKGGFNGDADEAEGQGYEPQDGKEKGGEEGQRPAKDKEDAPANEENQEFHIVTLSIFWVDEPDPSCIAQRDD